MEQDLIRQPLTKAFALAPMGVAVLIGLEDNGINPRIGEVFNKVLSSDQYRDTFTHSFTLAGIGQMDMQQLISGGLAMVNATLELAAMAINQVADNPQQAEQIKNRLCDFARDLALRMENRQPGDQIPLGPMYQMKLRYLYQRLGMDSVREEVPRPAQEQQSAESDRRSGSSKTTQIGYINRNQQRNLGTRGRSGNDHGQYVYKLACLLPGCGHMYGANGTDISRRKCPACQGGAAGIPY